MTETHYLALYRKYRPRTFDDVKGRDAIVRTLKNQIISGRISHSYLFCGTRGTGKTTIAKIFAQAINCEHPADGSPCGECPSCRAILEDASLNVVEMDAASNNGVDDIRGIIDEVAYSPTAGRYRVYIIDEAHMLSAAACNALLKTLEEPPSWAVFILATTEPNKLPLTILSRCQRYDFGRLSTGVIEGRLKEICAAEHLAVDDDALHYIAGAADGSMRDGISLLDQCNAFGGGRESITYTRALEILGATDPSVFHMFYQAVHNADAPEALKILDGILMQGRELMQFTADFLWYLRNLMLLRASDKTASSMDVTQENLERMRSDAGSSAMEEILRDIRIFSELSEQIRYSASRRILAEAAVIRACHPTSDTDTESLIAAFRQLESTVIEDEKELEELKKSGLPAAGAAGAAGIPGDGNGTSGNDQPAAQAAPSAKEATPEDAHNIAAEWPRIVGSMRQDGSPLYIRTLLSGTTCTDDGKGSLVVQFGDELSRRFFEDDESNRRALSSHIAQTTGFLVDILYRHLDKTGAIPDNNVDLSGICTIKPEEDDSI
ncbi:MAG: DNA polymerase III subunit gamma/tau [Lachnospiraceae bacterium]|jgi:DNA polymerase-3 subunit gamma/tau|nr:DNA polymerase III subunit gamma/tau [Lachnospiraceae bacterium]